MKKKYIIPEGTRDLVLDQCLIKKGLLNSIEDVFNSLGYEEVITPTIEFYQTFNDGFENLREEDIYKFFDKNGRILVLRPDMTIPIARIVATRFKDINEPLRFRYSANVFRLHESLLGKRNEYIDCGIEFIGAEGINSDIEVLSTALEALKTIKECNFRIEIGNINIFRSVVNDLPLSNEEAFILSSLINKRALKDLEKYLLHLNIGNEYREFFNELPWLFGDKSILEKCKKYNFNNEFNAAIEYLQSISYVLEELGYLELITFDLSMIPRLDYYTGLIFTGYVEGAGANILSGGRYDKLIEVFGKDIPAIGFSINIDILVEALNLNRPISNKVVRILYGKDRIVDAINSSKKLRLDGYITKLSQVLNDNNYFEIEKERE